MLADVNSPSSLVAEAETKLFRPADSKVRFKRMSRRVEGTSVMKRIKLQTADNRFRSRCTLIS